MSAKNNLHQDLKGYQYTNFYSPKQNRVTIHSVTNFFQLIKPFLNCIERQNINYFKWFRCTKVMDNTLYYKDYPYKESNLFRNVV